MQGLGLLLVLILLFWIWFSSLRTREAALRRVEQVLGESGLQLLDGSIYLRKVWPTRTATGTLGLLRFYHFDYTSNGADRYRGLIVMLANRMEYLQIEKDGHTVVTTAPD